MRIRTLLLIVFVVVLCFWATSWATPDTEVLDHLPEYFQIWVTLFFLFGFAALVALGYVLHSLPPVEHLEKLRERFVDQRVMDNALAALAGGLHRVNNEYYTLHAELTRHRIPPADLEKDVEALREAKDAAWNRYKAMFELAEALGYTVKKNPDGSLSYKLYLSPEETPT